MTNPDLKRGVFPLVEILRVEIHFGTLWYVSKQTWKTFEFYNRVYVNQRPKEVWDQSSSENAQPIFQPNFRVQKLALCRNIRQDSYVLDFWLWQVFQTRPNWRGKMYFLYFLLWKYWDFFEFGMKFITQTSIQKYNILGI